MSLPAYAADTGLYLLGEAGMTKFHDIDTTGIPNPSVDDTGTGFKIGGGYMFTRNLGVEVAYVDLGKATVSSGGQSVDAKASGEVIALALAFPLNDKFSILGRIGIINGTVKISGPGGSVDSTDVKPTIGIGAAFNITPQLGLRLDFDRYSKLGNNDTTGESNVDMIALGVFYKFK